MAVRFSLFRRFSRLLSLWKGTCLSCWTWINAFTPRMGYSENECSFLWKTSTTNVKLFSQSILKLRRTRRRLTKKLKAPRNFTELKTFFRVCNVFRRRVRNFAKLASPIGGELKNEQSFKFDLNEEGLDAMTSLLDKLFFISVLVLLYAKGQMTLLPDACEGEVTDM